MILTYVDLVKIHILQFLKIKFVCRSGLIDKHFYINKYILCHCIGMYIFCNNILNNCLSPDNIRLVTFIRIFDLKSRQSRCL